MKKIIVILLLFASFNISHGKTMSIIPKKSGFNTFVRTWYNKQLGAMKEPNILKKRSNEIYRFTWLRTFHHPIAISIYKENCKYFLISKMASGAGGYSPGKLVTKTKIELSESRIIEFKKLFNKLNFFNLNPNEVANGCDGSEWILEAKVNNLYHATTRWSPEKGDYYNCCKYLIDLSGFDIPKKEFY